MWTYEPETSKYGNKMIPAVKQFIVFLVGWIGFQAFALTIEVLISLIAQFYGLDPTVVLLEPKISMLVNSACYLVLLTAIILITNVDIIKLLKSFKQYQSYLAGVICLVAIIAFNNVYAMIVRLFPIPTSDNANESSIQTLTSLFPITCLVIFGIVGPICEEFTYRVGLFSLMRRRSRALAYLLTMVIFAFIHFNFSLKPATLLNEILNLPFYLFAAVAFSFTYEKFGLAGSLTAHILNNLISLIPFIAIIN